MNFKKYYPKTIAILMAFIFLYATVSKIFELNKFYYQLAKSPLIPYGYNEYVGNIVLLIELIIVYLVFKNKIQYSLLISFALMFFFSLYILECDRLLSYSNVFLRLLPEYLVISYIIAFSRYIWNFCV